MWSKPGITDKCQSPTWYKKNSNQAGWTHWCIYGENSTYGKHWHYAPVQTSDTNLLDNFTIISAQVAPPFQVASRARDIPYVCHWLGSVGRHWEEKYWQSPRLRPTEWIGWVLCLVGLAPSPCWRCWTSPTTTWMNTASRPTSSVWVSGVTV